MRPVYVTKNNVVPATPNTNTAATSGWVVLDTYISPGNVTLTVKITLVGTTTATGSVQVVYTTDNVFDPAAPDTNQVYNAAPFNQGTGSSTWTFSVSTTSTVAVAEAMFSYAPRAIGANLVLTTGSVNFETQVIQAGLGGT
jgi:hypothetical protein